VLGLVGCTTPPPSPKAQVAAAELSLTAAGRLALQYMGRAPCPQPTGTLCADATIKLHIRQAYDAAYDTVTAAQATADAGGTPDLTVAQATLASLNAVVAAPQ
jgi:hypothetical protein